MKLQKMTLQNFRCFENLEIDFDDRLTVLVGVNGSGKTALLEAARIALSNLLMVTGGSVQAIMDHDVRYTHIQQGSQVFKIDHYPVMVEAAGTFLDQPVQWAFIANDRGELGNVDPAQGDFSKIEKDFAIDETVPFVRYFGAKRRWHGKGLDLDKQKGPEERTAIFRDVLDGDFIYAELNKWFFRMFAIEFERFQSNVSEPIVEFVAVKNAMRDFFISSMECEKAQIRYDFVNEELQIFYTMPSGEEHRQPISELSDGYKTALMMVADIAYRMARLNAHLGDKVLKETPGVVLIDEIDLHLHPKWQQHILIDLMKTFPELQWIVTTHAPAVIQSVKAQHLRLLDGGKVKRATEQSYGRKISDVVEDIMGVSARPPETAEELNAIYDALEGEDYAEATRLTNILEKKIGLHDTDITRIRTTIALEQEVWE